MVERLPIQRPGGVSAAGAAPRHARAARAPMACRSPGRARAVEPARPARPPRRRCAVSPRPRRREQRAERQHVLFEDPQGVHARLVVRPQAELEGREHVLDESHSESLAARDRLGRHAVGNRPGPALVAAPAKDSQLEDLARPGNRRCSRRGAISFASATSASAASIRPASTSHQASALRAPGSVASTPCSRAPRALSRPVA